MRLVEGIQKQSINVRLLPLRFEAEEGHNCGTKTDDTCWHDALLSFDARSHIIIILLLVVGCVKVSVKPVFPRLKG